MAYDNNPQDENAIRDLLARYIDAVNRVDQDAWAATWAEDATWALMGTEISGRSNLVPFWAAAMGSFEFVVMVLNSNTVQIDGDVATGRSYVTEHLNAKEGGPAMVLGIYDDTFSKIDGEWLFTSRRYNVLYSGGSDLSGDYVPYPG